MAEGFRFPLFKLGDAFPEPFPEGLLLGVDKPLGWSSFDIVKKLRYLLMRRLSLRRIKVGHAGTLDPLATGLLVLCIGKATSLVEQLQEKEKEYVGTLTFGATTASHDREQPINATFPTDHLNDALIQAALQRFKGDVEQVPPVFSALKVNGRRLYREARQGHEGAVRARRIRIELFEVSPLRPVISAEDQCEPRCISQKGVPIWLYPEYAHGKQCDFRVVCSKGTYVRSLVADLGRAVGSGAYLSKLRRIRSGSLNVEEAWTVETLEAWIRGQAGVNQQK